ncbi:MAG: Fe-S cluster assembly protein SufD [Calditrichia bacterium]
MKTSDFKTMTPEDWYVANFRRFENSLNGEITTPFHTVRQEAIARFSELGFPTTRNEEWKYTSISPLLKKEFTLGDETAKLSPQEIKKYTFKGLEETVVVLINGCYYSELSTFRADQKGVLVEGMAAAFAKHPQLISNFLAKYADYRQEPFVALNTAFTLDGVFVYIPEGTVIEKPIHLLNISAPAEDNSFSNPRILIVAGRDSKVQLVETHEHYSGYSCFVNQVTEIVLEEKAVVDHIKIQDENLQTYHIANRQVHQSKGSNYSSVNIDLGGALVRNNLNVKLNDENCEAHLIGFYLGKDNQHVDNHTFMDHAMPNCHSNELYKGILDDKSRGVFNGKIMVRKDAQKTNAYQNNKSLLLSDFATMNAKPQLEIFADDVKCSHGATVGELDEEALFYLRTRGIALEKARAILQYAFASDVFSYIKIEAVREKLDEILHERLSKNVK